MELQEMLSSYRIQEGIKIIANPQLLQLLNAYIKLLPICFAIQILFWICQQLSFASG